MPKTELPVFTKKRKLLYETKDKNQLVKHGDMFFEADHIDDALDFYEMAGNEEGFRKIEAVARKEGNLYLYRKVCKLMKDQPSKDITNEIGMKAIELGKLSMALDAFSDTGNEGMKKKVDQMLEGENPEKKTE